MTTEPQPYIKVVCVMTGEPGTNRKAPAVGRMD